MRYATAIISALLLGGATATLALQPGAAAGFGQTAQNDPSQMAQVAPRAGAPTSFADLVAKLQPAVVNISTTQKLTLRQPANPFAGTPLEGMFGQMQGQGGGAPVTREAQSLGSGFIISADGYVVTNNHVIAPGARGASVESITVTLPDRTEYTAKLIGRDQASDLALLKIVAPKPLPFVRFGDSTRARTGDWVVAIGNPFGLGGTVTAGIVSALHRNTPGGGADRFIQTDAAINQGNSGGPMFNLSGEVIGINSQILGSQGGGNIGIGFAIPAEQAKPVIDTLMKGGTVRRGYLGVGIRPVDNDIAAALALPKNQGEIVGTVEPGGPAARGGLKVGDVVIRVNGQAVTPDQTLSYLVAAVTPGSTARLDVIRDGKPATLSVAVGTRPAEDKIAGFNPQGDDDGDGIPDDDQGTQAEPSRGSLGVSVQPLTPQIAQAVGVDSTVQGVVVTSTDPSSDAAQKLKRGDVIQSVNSVPVRTAADLTRGVAQAKAAGRPQVLLLVNRGRGNAGFIAVKIR